MQQLVFYDNGVGTSGFRPIRYLAQAFGFGLFRNVRTLYLALCRHYRPGDEICLFGFSRGAFTVRVLADLIAQCGILDRSLPAPNAGGLSMASEDGLKKGATEAYKAYRRIYWDKSNAAQRLINACARNISRLWRSVYSADEFATKFSHLRPAGGMIGFMGVWDTVDAHGLPVEEMSWALDQLFYPYRLYDYRLGPQVARARQALSIDDSRHTFTPLLWDEPPGENPDRIRQVWFAGMHADVGGGYPEDRLAHIPLVWMMEEAQKAGVRFDEAAFNAYRSTAQATGKMHDSRRGAAVYYRYRPRSIKSLVDTTRKNGESSRLASLVKRMRESGSKILASRNMKGPLSTKDLSVDAGMPIIHHSVVERIRDDVSAYSPTAIDCTFQQWGRNGKPGPGMAAKAEENRLAFLDRCASHIIWRRVCYFGMLAFTLYLAGLVLSAWLDKGYQLCTPSPDLKHPLASVLGWLSGFFSGFPMGVVAYALKAWANVPGKFALGLAGMAVFHFWSVWFIEPRLNNLAGNAWKELKNSTISLTRPEPGMFERIARWYRYSGFRNFVRNCWEYLVSGLVFVAGVVLVLWVLGTLIPPLKLKGVWYFPLWEALCLWTGRIWEFVKALFV